ncbi:MAG: hypothetical protein OXT71_12235 [Acidobacteriota bacterium]|nr:hypothetical protein [Acidobacteriota bacterium]
MRSLIQHGKLGLGQLFRLFPRLKLVDELANRHRFHHWELAFADVFYGPRAGGSVRAGFDLIVGNPPWVKVEWDEKGVLGDFDPVVVVQRLSPKEVRKRMEAAVTEDPVVHGVWFDEMEATEATQTFLNATQNYPLLSGQKVNLYKCFLPEAWRVASPQGVVGLLHPEGPYDDPNAGVFRAALYPRLRGHYQFINERRLFPEVDHHTKFSINIYGHERQFGRLTDALYFSHIANLFAPTTVDACLENDGHGRVPGVKDDHWQWNLAGHSRRVISVGFSELQLFAALYDKPDTPPLEARLPALHSQELVAVLERLADQPTSLGDLRNDIRISSGWNETIAQLDGTIRRHTGFPNNPRDVILSGPHYFCGNPLYKTPRRSCAKNSDYDVLDLDKLPDDYLPRTNYVRACDQEDYDSLTDQVSWIGEEDAGPRQFTEYFRVVSREMVGSTLERTLSTALLPRGVHHLYTSMSTAFLHTRVGCDFGALTMSVVLDFFIKTTGTGHVTPSFLHCLPLLSPGCDPFIRFGLRLRSLILNCLTIHYADLWEKIFTPEFRRDSWAKPDPLLSDSFFANLTPCWSRHVALRTDYARRQALVEIDVLTAMAFGLTLDELCTIYRVQFPILNQYERNTWYDRNGRIVFTVSRGLVGVGLPRKKRKNDTCYGIRTDRHHENGIALGWEDICNLKHGVVTRTIMDDTLPDGPFERTIEYLAPFDRCDREEDYRTAWAAFERRLRHAPE